MTGLHGAALYVHIVGRGYWTDDYEIRKTGFNNLQFVITSVTFSHAYAMACSLARKYPLKKGPEYKPPVPRWMLKFDSAIAKIFVAYLGVQQHDSTSIVNKAYGQARTAVKAWIDAPESQITWYERFNVEDGFDIASSDVWVCYWADETAFKQSFKRLQLAEMYQELGSGHEGVGLWCESFTTPVERVETNYARLEHVPGLANLPGTEQVEHNLSAYWGAGRDVSRSLRMVLLLH